MGRWRKETKIHGEGMQPSGSGGSLNLRRPDSLWTPKALAETPGSQVDCLAPWVPPPLLGLGRFALRTLRPGLGGGERRT